MKGNKLSILKNSILLYMRMILIMVINLASVRLLLQLLGETDFGIYNVVGGCVAMLAFLSSSMSSAAQRFYAFYIAKDDDAQLLKVFQVSLCVFLIILALTVILAETLGLWFVNTQLTIPSNRVQAVYWVYQFTIMTFAEGILMIPFLSMVLSLERMDVFAIVSTIDAIIKLLLIYLLKSCAFSDNLIFYSFFVSLTGLGVLITYAVFVKQACSFLKYIPKWNTNLFKQIFSYCSWFMFGAMATAFKNQGINILINMFFNPIVNAASGIAYQINSAVTVFVGNFYSAVRPQVIKRYSLGNYGSLNSLVEQSTRLSFYLLLLIAIPLCIWMTDILNIWLNDPPLHTASFARLVILISFFETIGQPLTTAICADVKIKKYQITTGIMTLLILPISYCLLYLGLPPESTFLSAVLISVVTLFVKIYFASMMLQLNVHKYMAMLIKFCLLSLFTMLIPVYLKYAFFDANIVYQGINIILSIIYISICLFFLGLDKTERSMVYNFFLSKFKG